MEPESLKVEVETVGEAGRRRIVVSGELDLATVPALDAALAPAAGAKGGDLVLDLRQVTFIDSSGIRCILDACHRSRQRGVRMSILPGLETGVVFGLAGLTGRLPLVG